MSNRSADVEFYRRQADHWEKLCLKEKDMMMTYMIEVMHANKGLARKNRRIRSLIEQMGSESCAFLRIAEKYSPSIKSFNSQDLARLCLSIIHGKHNELHRHVRRHRVDGLMIEGGTEAVAVAAIVEAARRYCSIMGGQMEGKQQDEELLKQFPQIDLFEEAQRGTARS